MPVEEKEVPEVEVDEFEEAFEEAVEKEGGEEEAPTEDPEEPELEDEEETPTSEESEEEPVEEEPAKEEAPAEEPEESAEKSVADLEKELQELNQRHSSLQGMYNSEVKKDKAPKEEPISDEPKEEEEDFTPVTEAMSKQIGGLDSVKALKEEYGDDIGGALNDVAGLVIKTVMGDVSKRLNAQIGEVSEKIGPLQSQQDRADRDAFDSLVVSVHSDYHKYVNSGELGEWAESQTGLQGKSFRTAFTGGTNEDVIELVAAFRESKGYADKKEEDPAKKKEEIDTSKLEDMEVVDTKKTPVNASKKGAVDKDDYEGAWDEAK